MRGFDLFSDAATPMLALAAIYVVACVAVSIVDSAVSIRLVEVLLNIALFPLLSGLSILAYKCMSRGYANFSDGLEVVPYYVRLLALALVDGTATIALTMLISSLLYGTDEMQGLLGGNMLSLSAGGRWGLLLAAFLVLVAFRSLFYFASYFVLFYNMSVTQALREGVQLTMRHFGGVLLLSAISTIFLSLGAVLFYLGLIIALPIVYAIGYAAFEDLALFKDGGDTGGVNDVLEHLLLE